MGWQQFGEDVLDPRGHLILCSSQCSEEGKCRRRVVRQLIFERTRNPDFQVKLVCSEFKKLKKILCHLTLCRPNKTHLLIKFVPWWSVCHFCSKKGYQLITSLSVNNFSLLTVVHSTGCCIFYIIFPLMLPFIAIHISMNLIIEGRCQGEGKRSPGENFSQAVTHTAVPIPQAQTMKLNYLQKLRLQRVAARGSWKKEENTILPPPPKSLQMLLPQNTCGVENWGKRHIMMFRFFFCDISFLPSLLSFSL